MKKSLSLLIILALVICVPIGVSLSDEDPTGASLPKNMPEKYEAVCTVEGTETKGVTFAISEVLYDEDTLKISVLQLPNDEYTSIIDNQVEDTSNSNYLDAKLKLASQYGNKVLGTVCDILSITDSEGNNLIKEYKVSVARNGASLETMFYIYFLPEHTEIAIELLCGVTEDLHNHCSSYKQIHLDVSRK